MAGVNSLPLVKNLDEKVVLNEFEDVFESASATNFAICFNDAQACGAVGLEKDSLERILSSKAQLLARRYGFSPRLLALMTSQPPPGPNSNTSSRTTTHHSASSWPRRKRTPDLEKDMVRSDSSWGSKKEDPLQINHYQIVREIWHFSSVDFGPKYMCLGYNSLYEVGREDKKSRLPSQESSKPAGNRVWTWLVLCDDYTIISIHESFATIRASASSLAPIRRHIGHILLTLSRATEPMRADNPIMTLTLRSEIHPETKLPVRPISPSEASSLLFYYIFDDWYTSYSLVARKNHQYGSQLEQLRRDMFDSARLEHVNTLHHYGRQLAVLKKIYQSYNRIIDRVLERQKVLKSEPDSNPSDDTNLNSYGVRLPTAATVRFQALQDRINLFPMSEIQECLDEKEALVAVNFNLIGIKEANFVDKLTRITILLAKATILFLPVSLMTGYFSAPLTGDDKRYTVAQFWIAFAVILVVTYVLLFFFGQLSGTQETKTIYRSLTRAFFEESRDRITRRKPTVEPEDEGIYH
ncbi:hypothetical protein MMC25_001699 [Agyrium rufum]|nr:hypothetical protein [Agyrium rufum]